MSSSLSATVRERARRRCEYCGLPEVASALPFEIDHIIARKHGGATILDNLALACAYCNNAKGTDLAGIDPLSGAIVTLFHPRRDRWADHFHRRGARIEGRTPRARGTLAVLKINDPLRLAIREALLDAGLWPEPG